MNSKSTYFLLLLCLSIFIGGAADARTVKIKWDLVDGAVKYDLILYQGGQEVLKTTHKVESTAVSYHVWRDNVSPGYYAYKIRGIDRFEVAGDWTPLKLLVVKPTKVQQVNPLPGAKLRLDENSGRLILRWNPLGRRVSYRLDLRIDNKPFFKILYEKSEFEIIDPRSGLHQWKVTPFIQAAGSVDKTLLHGTESETTGESVEFKTFDLEVDEQYRSAKKRVVSSLPPTKRR